MTRWRAGWALAALVPAAFLAVFFAWPAATLVARGFHDGTGWTLDGFASVFGSARTWRAGGFTLGSASIATVACLLLGIPGAYVLYRTRFRGRDTLRALVTIPVVLPTVVVGVAFGSLLRADGLLGWLNLGGTPTAIIAAMVFFNYSVVVRTVGVLWSRLDPRLAQAASTLGAPPLRGFLTVTLPALGPTVLSAASLVFLFSASSYGIVMVLGRNRFATIETEIWFLTTQLLDLPAAAALSIAQLLIVTAALWLSGRAQTRMTGALRLQPDVSATRPLSARRDLASLATTAAVATLLLGLPLANLLWRSLHGADGLGLGNYTRLATATAQGTTVWRALSTTLTTALAATGIALALGMLVALVASRRPRQPVGRAALGTLESMFLLPLGVSAVTVGFGYLITLNRPPLDLRSSIVLIPIAQAVVALPLVIRSLLPTLRAIDPRQLEAAATLGSGPFEVLRRIELPTCGVAWGSPGFRVRDVTGRVRCHQLPRPPGQSDAARAHLPLVRQARYRELRLGTGGISGAGRIGGSHDGRRRARSAEGGGLVVDGLEVRGAVVRYGKITAVAGVDLLVPRGRVVGLLGPSGSGKSTLLRAVAGLEPLTAGTISWDGVDLAEVKVHQRNFGMVFQDGQLFPTMTVGKNVAYGLGKLAKAEQQARVAEMLELVGLPGYESRKPTELSGGQAQRVALARSLAPSPRALLLDEPLSALDTGLRRRLSEDLARILRETHTTAIYVTHDQLEAYSVADEVAVIGDGRLQQFDDPESLRERPASREVATFLGYRAFIDEAEARALGWDGTLPKGHLLGIGASSMVLADDGVELPVVDQGYTVDDVEVHVTLPGGQRAIVSSPVRIHNDTVRVRLMGGAVTPE